MEKINLKLEEFLTLAGPAQLLEIKEESKDPGDGVLLYEGTKAKIRDHAELLSREIKMLQPAASIKAEGKFIFRIWLFPEGRE